MRDCGGIARSARSTNLLSEAPANGLILFALWGELPTQHIFLLDHRGSPFTMHGDGFWQSRVNASCGLNHAQRAGLETQTGNSGVLNLDALVGERGSESRNLPHWAHHPQEQIDIVNRLIHQRSTAVERSCPFPAAFIVVGLRPPPLTRGLAQRQSPEP